MLKLHNTLNNKKVDFTPIDGQHIKLYVCGPTVYNFPHIGNARSVVVYDLLFRLLGHLYPEVTYVRNITDVDDKIIAAAQAENKEISAITTYYTDIFQRNMLALGCLPPTIEPKATEHIDEMIVFIQRLIDNNHAYVIDGAVYFAISSYKQYGCLSGRKLEDLIAGSRVAVDDNKRHPGDFILWKPTTSYGWSSPWGYGRPGWHLECSVMSNQHLGVNFDIHGGGADLQFPHHENEIAQSICAHPGSTFANYWVHNGFVLVNNEKMSKSLGNVVTVQQLLEKNIPGEVIRYILLSTHYRKPLNWTDTLLSEAMTIMNKFMEVLNDYQEQEEHLCTEVTEALCDDLNTPQTIAILHKQAKAIKQGQSELIPVFFAGLKFLGLVKMHKEDESCNHTAIDALVAERKAAKGHKDFATADRIRLQLQQQGIELHDLPDGTTTWKKQPLIK